MTKCEECKVEIPDFRSNRGHTHCKECAEAGLEAKAHIAKGDATLKSWREYLKNYIALATDNSTTLH
jgi:hypothetical protein